MKYKVEWSAKANKQFAKLQKRDQASILEATRKLADSETWHNVRKLVNHQYSHRLRVGNYRVLFDADDSPLREEKELRVLDVQEVKKRDDRTY